VATGVAISERLLTPPPLVARQRIASDGIGEPMKTFSVSLHGPPAILVRTDGKTELFTFRTKRQADKKLLKLIEAGYTLDRYNPAPDIH
jgi:hypothetical protein